jgi:hypothetical protein
MARRLALVLALVIIASLLIVACGGGGNSEPTAAEKKTAVKFAKLVYGVAKAHRGFNLSKGPCLSNPMPVLGGDWVADIAHDPRRPVDDKPQNQCSAYRSGQAHHFVELDPSGKLIRTQ